MSPALVCHLVLNDLKGIISGWRNISGTPSNRALAIELNVPDSIFVA